MKTKILFVLLAIALVAMIPAQGQEGSGREPRTNRPAAETVTVTGSMVVARGVPALKSGDVTYYVTGINSLIGFVDGLREGAQVSVEGRVMANPRDETVKYLNATKLTIGGRSYEIAAPSFPLGAIASWWGSHMPQRFQAPMMQRPRTPQRQR